ncbi:hypothetical protein HYV80_04605 [Candidatus Woesearchaeota archaeon]|nr:hypothetical protein [Candidatus Woesearchaeota archaeon]
MEFKWVVNKEDIERLNNFVDKFKGNNFVKGRVKRNLSDSIPQFTESEFWKWMIGCLLTTQQRSGPNSRISKFLIITPFPLSYDSCKKTKNLKNYSYEVLTKSRGIRRTNKISEEIKFNFDWLVNDGWEKIINISEKLMEARKQKPSTENIKVEREACLLVQDLKGIGPKQSRNLWQAMGLTRYEIPIDSRIIKWLNKNEFPFTLSPSGLSDENYYQMLMGGIQEWCERADIFPCIFDAAIFSSYDEEWPEDYELW